MPPVVTFQGVVHPCASVEEFSVALDAFDLERQFELWLNEPKGPAVCMLRNGGDAWLMYLRQERDSGFTSLGDTRLSGAVSYRLSNGQTDEFPAAWCVPVESCYKALAYFFVNRGLRPELLAWRES